MHHSPTPTTRNNNAKHIQHNNPSPTKHHPPTHSQTTINQKTKTSLYFKKYNNKSTQYNSYTQSTHIDSMGETILATYKAITRHILECVSTIWSALAAVTNINKLHITQNTAHIIETGCTTDTNTQHLHVETHTLPIKEHLQLHASQRRQNHNTPHTHYTTSHHNTTHHNTTQQTTQT